MNDKCAAGAGKLMEVVSLAARSVMDSDGQLFGVNIHIAADGI